MLTDSHCHLDAPEFDGDREAVIARARAAGVGVLVVPAVAAEGFSALAEIARGHAGVHAAYGLHPMFLERHRPEHLEQLREALGRHAPVAVGECGLDFFVPGLDAELQHYYFRAQLDLAREFGLPLIVHARRAVEEVIHTLRERGGLRGVIHSYSGSAEQARQLWQMGFLLGIGGPVSYQRAQRLRRLVAEIPLEQLLLESDAPDQADQWHRGQRNEPAYLPAILEVIAELRQMPPQELAEATSANARRLFGIA